MYPDGCVDHSDGCQYIKDTMVTTKARMSLPRILYLKVANNQNAEGGTIPQSALGILVAFIISFLYVFDKMCAFHGPEYILVVHRAGFAH